ISILSPSSRCAADERDRRTRAIREREDTSHGAVCIIICRVGIASYRILDPRFFILFMSVMHLGMEPAQFHDFIQGTGDRHGATLRAAEKSSRGPSTRLRACPEFIEGTNGEDLPFGRELSAQPQDSQRADRHQPSQKKKTSHAGIPNRPDKLMRK